MDIKSPTNYLAFNCGQTTDTRTILSDESVKFHGIKTWNDEVVVRSPHTNAMYILRATGRTRKFFGGLVCPTFTMHMITTEVEDGIIVGNRGSRVNNGTWAIRPEAFKLPVSILPWINA